MPSDQMPPQGPDSTEARLQQINAELDQLRQTLSSQLQGEIQQLQHQKTQLQRDIASLETQRRTLVQQLAPTVAAELKKAIANQNFTLGSGSGNGAIQGDYSAVANRLIADLDATLRSTFKTIQYDLNSYQSSLSQQLSQMYTLEQQGEAILDALVLRLKEELKSNPPTRYAPQTIARPVAAPATTPAADYGYQQDDIIQDEPLTPEPYSEPLEPKTYTPNLKEKQSPTKKEAGFSKAQLGLMLILFSSLMLSLQNVVIKIILKENLIFGMVTTGGYISPGIGNSLLILFLRMVFVVPAMCLIAKSLHPSSFKDIERFIQARDWMLIGKVAVCGFALFLSQLLIYTALGSLSPGVAITIFFIFPIVTLLLTWLFFGEKPSPVRWGVAVIVVLGVALISAPFGGDNIDGDVGSILAAIFSGVSFAVHVLLIQSCTKKIHPIPFSVVNFSSILIFSSFSLLLTFTPLLGDAWQIDVAPENTRSVLISGMVLGVITLLSYLSNNIGISYIGAAISSIVGATGPVLTSVLSFIIIGQGLVGQQVLGMLVVTAGVLALNLERMYRKKPQNKTKAAN